MIEQAETDQLGMQRDDAERVGRLQAVALALVRDPDVAYPVILADVLEPQLRLPLPSLARWTIPRQR